MKPRDTKIINQAMELRLLAVLGLALIPLVGRLPLWVMLFVTAVAGWRTLAVIRGWRPLNTAARFCLAALAFAGVFLMYGHINGKHAGAALLALMLVLKLTEVRSRRDRVVTLLLAYFALITLFLFSQSIATAAYAFAAAWLITAVLLEVNHPNGPSPPIRYSLRKAGVLIGQALPLMIILFVLFPRIPGPLWGLPKNSGVAVTGLSDTMAPGTIARVARNTAVAFRARFPGNPPPKRALYWRGPVMTHYNGIAWSAGENIRRQIAPVLSKGDGLRYQIILEPTGTHQLIALDFPVASPPDAYFTVTGEMLSEDTIDERVLYHARSVLDYRFQPALPPCRRRRNLDLPAGIDPRTHALVRKWQRAGYQGRALAQRVLRYFRQKPFVYTLQPPPLPGANNVDAFLFRTRSGFCAHYAGAFTVMMRMAGIPARVVTGYQGGERNGDYLIVRQSDAHAWSEIWLAGQGWVRFDPTAAAPKRVRQGPVAALPTRQVRTLGLARRGIWHRLGLRWDWIQATWNRMILAYGPKLQAHFLARFGLPNKRAMALALTALVVGFLALLGVWLIWQARPPRTRDPVARGWERFCARLARRGIPRRPSKAPGIMPAGSRGAARPGPGR